MPRPTDPLAAVSVTIALVLAATVHAAISPADLCETAKLKHAGKYGACRLNAESKAVKTGEPPDFTKCDEKYAGAWQKAEDKAAGSCPTTGDATDIQDVVTEHSDLLALLLDGGGGGGEDPDAIYVRSDTGVDDSSCGTIASPCASISQGILRAVTDTKLRVYVAALAYFEDVDIADGIDVLGGYDPGSWTASASPSVVYGTAGSGHRAAVTASGIASATTVSGLEIHGATATTPGSNSYAVYVSASTNQLSLTDNVLYPGHGAPGSGGSPGMDGSDGTDGAGRESSPATYDAVIASGAGACNASNNRQLSNGGALICGVSDVSGGAGGGNDCPASSVLAEQSGNDGTATGGAAGGDAGDDGRLESSGSLCSIPAASVSGADGSDGNDGNEGSSGPGCSSPAGSVIAGHWVGASGSSGMSGTNGSGGGGGGAGGGAYCLSCTEGKDRLGGHGGGGASGGCAGAGGGSGGGGGGSFGLFVVGGSAPVVSGNTIFRGAGGSGGHGGAAGSGGSGGDGGSGGAGSLFCTGSAGKGGQGGSGGHGAGGGGGCGGGAYGVYTSGIGTPSYCATNTVSGGAAGAGGAGGPSLGNNGSTGASGLLVGCSFN